MPDIELLPEAATADAIVSLLPPHGSLPDGYAYMRRPGRHAPLLGAWGPVLGQWRDPSGAQQRPLLLAAVSAGAPAPRAPDMPPPPRGHATIAGRTAFNLLKVWDDPRLYGQILIDLWSGGWSGPRLVPADEPRASGTPARHVGGYLTHHRLALRDASSRSGSREHARLRDAGAQAALDSYNESVAALNAAYAAQTGGQPAEPPPPTTNRRGNSWL